METFIAHSLIIILLYSILLPLTIIILAYFGYFPKPKWMIRMISQSSNNSLSGTTINVPTGNLKITFGIANSQNVNSLTISNAPPTLELIKESNKIYQGDGDDYSPEERNIYMDKTLLPSSG